MQIMPQARRSGLIVKAVGGEILIYDQERNKAHCLNPTAAEIWKYCDGETTLTAACQLLSVDLNTRVDEELVKYAVDQFFSDHLLEENNVPPAFMISGMNRRQVVRTLGLAALVAVPLVTSIVAPTPALAASPLPAGSSCTDPSECQSGLCPGAPTGTCS